MILIILENMYFSFWWEFWEYDDGKTHIAWKSTHSPLMMGRWESCGAVVPDSWEILEYIYIYASNGNWECFVRLQIVITNMY